MEVPTVHPPQEIRIDHFSKEELLKAQQSIKEGKAFREDSIAPDIPKRVGLNDLILRFCNRVLDDGSAPDQWRQLNIVPLLKKGNLTKVDNYRGIVLTSIVSKTLDRMILNRIRPAMENILRINQTAYGIPQNFVKLVEAMYKDTLARVITEDGLTGAFFILAGVMQGDTLAPYLFVIAIDYVITTALVGKELGFTVHPRRRRRHPAVKVTDDLAPTTDNACAAEA
ncbi:hypothetical protein ACHWQZ_G005950 [Mnemiopsis leidyi]